MSWFQRFKKNAKKTVSLTFKSTADERYSDEWRLGLELDLHAFRNVQFVDIGGGVDLTNGEADNDFEATGTAEDIAHAIKTLEAAGRKIEVWA